MCDGGYNDAIVIPDPRDVSGDRCYTAIKAAVKQF